MSIVLKNIVVTRSGRRLVDDVSLEIVPGVFTVLMGENGAGKSTLLKIAAGDFDPDDGEVTLARKPLNLWSRLELAKRRAVLPQESNIAFMFTALEVVLIGRSPHCHGYPGPRDREIARAALARMDVSHLANRIYPTLSGGERARVALARVLAQLWESNDNGDAVQRYLLLDEPIAALDIAHQQVALNVSQSFAHEHGVAVLAVLHDLNLAAQFADRIVLLKHGRLIASGSPDDVLTEGTVETCFGQRMRRIAHPETGRPLLFAA